MSVGQSVFGKPAKFAIFSAIGFLVMGLLMDGDYRRLIMSGIFGLILFVGALIAERLRPTAGSADGRQQ